MLATSLSSQLYKKSTHFLLELIQNADDNSYNTPTPTLSFSYTLGHLRVDCNEVGFTADNVEAICGINQSTKRGKKNDGEQIGEKGIGFKSVFKAADVVWISSRDFAFKFDNTKFLGMVSPTWAVFPANVQPGWTSIWLDFTKNFEENTLARELTTFDPNVLMFLRQLKQICIRTTCDDGTIHEQRIVKTESQIGDDRTYTLHTERQTSEYLIRSHVIEDLPQEKRRPNWKRTEILLGFPEANGPGMPQRVPQNVYAYLPIRNYGLKASNTFLI